MQIHALSDGLFESNTYLVEENGLCTVLDCGSPASSVLSAVSRLGWRITHLVLTHGHLDHTAHVAALKRETGAIVCLHEAEQALFADPCQSGYAMFGMTREPDFPAPDRLLKGEEVLETGGPVFQVLHAPGHTSGGICLLTGDWVFTGDTLFCRGVGRTDLPTGNGRELVSTIREVLYTLSPGTIVYPGHGPATTIGEERAHNPHVKAN